MSLDQQRAVMRKGLRVHPPHVVASVTQQPESAVRLWLQVHRERFHLPRWTWDEVQRYEREGVQRGQ